jgi:hypothetical protein
MAQLANHVQAIPAELSERTTSRKNLKFIIGVLLIIALIMGLIVQAMMATGAKANPMK